MPTHPQATNHAGAHTSTHTRPPCPRPTCVCPPSSSWRTYSWKRGSRCRRRTRNALSTFSTWVCVGGWGGGGAAGGQGGVAWEEGVRRGRAACEAGLLLSRYTASIRPTPHRRTAEPVLEGWHRGGSTLSDGTDANACTSTNRCSRAAGCGDLSRTQFCRGTGRAWGMHVRRHPHGARMHPPC
jgi:hypothetical protein